MAEIIVAVVDSGVHPDHPHIDRSRLLDGLVIASDGRILEQDCIPLDRLGHGTAVTAAVQEKAPEALILPIRVFHDALRTSPLALVTAIELAVAQGASIINLSLGTTNRMHRALFESALANASEALVIAAAEAEGVPCLPGALDGVLGVGLDWDLPREEWRWQDGHLIASGYPRPIEGVPQRRNLYGISFAVAQASGFAARAAQSLAAPTPAAILAALA